MSQLCIIPQSPRFFFSSSSTFVTQTQIYLPDTFTFRRNYVSVTYRYNNVTVTCSCNGIFSGLLKAGSYFLWNPLEIPGERVLFYVSFDYDHFINNYTLRTDYWTRLEDIPTNYHIHRSQIFLSGIVNWLASNNSSMYFILSLDLEESYRQLWLPDLEKESYRQLWLPDFENENENGPWILDVMRNCMCVFATSDVFLDVWIMEYGSEESWTKLYSVPNMQHRGLEVYKALYISEDDTLLLQCYEIESGDMKLVV